MHAAQDELLEPGPFRLFDLRQDLGNRSASTPTAGLRNDAVGVPLLAAGLHGE